MQWKSWETICIFSINFNYKFEFKLINRLFSERYKLNIDSQILPRDVKYLLKKFDAEFGNIND